jgi:hypothetical protein
VKEVCKRICKRTTQHTVTRGITSRDHRMRNTKLEQTVSYQTALGNMGILELENRCTGDRVKRTRRKDHEPARFAANPVFLAID